jgi:hypothetical protein
MVSIAAFQAVDPGSIPGHRNIFSPKYFRDDIFIIILIDTND